MKMPPLPMASLAGAETTAAFGAISEAAESSLPTLGYTVRHPVSTVLLSH